MGGFWSKLFGDGFGSRWSYETPKTGLRPALIVKTPHLSFGVPWPWEEVPTSAITNVDVSPLVAVTAPRTDGRVPLFLVTRRGPWVGPAATDMGRLLSAFAEHHMARALGIRRVALGGVPANVLCTEKGERQLLRVLICRHGDLVEGDFDVPSRGYLRHLEVMLATWRWLDK